MDARRFDTLTRLLRGVQTRRKAAHGGLSAIAALGFGAAAAPAVATAKRRKKGKRRRKPKRPPSCAKTCADTCSLCVRRKKDSVLCSSGVTGVAVCGAPCVSDNDCVGTSFPYCVTQTENRQSGLVLDLECNGVLGLCTAIAPCAD
jgi:hypothetical protein